MANKKDFSGINTGQVFTQLERATSQKGKQPEVSPQEKAEREATMHTQGRKGCAAKRINMAFSTDNYQFLKVMASASGRTMTDMCNLIISAYRREHPEILAKAQGFLDEINSGKFSFLLGDPTNDN